MRPRRGQHDNASLITVQLDAPQRDFAEVVPSEKRLQHVFAVQNLLIPLRWPAEIAARLAFPRARSKLFGQSAARRGLQSSEASPQLFSIRYLAASKALVPDVEQRHLAPHLSKEIGIHPADG